MRLTNVAFEAEDRSHEGELMAHTFTSLHYHVVFSTAGRRNLIPDDLSTRVHAYMGGVIRSTTIG